ncbi:HBS1-like protein [Madurella mycetomatis]|uniref:Elongation factor 1 alpha-like protein n=1 Tax=Madurella mycetomatis TaxID=100816 RepID=A0A150ASK9_9PEZI|nr:HBS1-like protein [Madurella mycetomatis]
MSRHQYIRNLDYQDAVDEYEGYSEDGEDELSPEDRVLMAQGTADVQAALGVEASKVTVAQIEEALWHYYYDVDKSVAYLTAKFVNPRPKPTKPAAKQPNGKSVATVIDPTASALHDELGTPSYWAGGYLDMTDVGFTRRQVPYPQFPGPPHVISFERPKYLSCLFRDMPWGNIPKHREAILTAPPLPRAGLLGGSGAPPKMSKLQALAAARKKKAEERSASQEKVEQARAKMTELSVGEASAARESSPLAGAFSKRLKTSESTAQGRLPLVASEPTRAEQSQLPGELPVEPALVQAPERFVVDKAQQSPFAQTLFGSPSDILKSKRQEFYPLYADLPPSVLDAFSQPSPDDVVLAAQAKAGKKTTAPQTKKKGASSADAVAEDAKELKISEAPLPKSRNLDVLSEFEKSRNKKSASFVVVGHVDAGKSTMMGRLLLDLKVVDQRTVDKLRKEAETIGKTSFALAWLLDQRSEERSRGVTIDIATNRFETETTAFTILDAPGHRDFIPNMIAGASQADFAILVIDASTGAFESGLKGQTKEHSLLIRSMGVSRVIVAINKLDAVGWSQERYNEIKDQVSGFLSVTGFQHKNLAFVPVSGLHGDNLVQRSPDPAASWYTGPTLIEELENSEPNARALAKPLRMTISEVYRTMQSPVTVSGRIDAGSLQMGDALLVQPSGEKAYVKSVLVDDAPADWAVAGQNVVLFLSHIDSIHIKVGDIICDPAKPMPRADTFTMKALAFDFLMPMQVDVHRGRLHTAGRIEAIPALLDKVTGVVTKKKPKIVKPATVARIVVKLEAQVPLEAGQRVVLRSGGQTVAAGLLE